MARFFLLSFLSLWVSLGAALLNTQQQGAASRQTHRPPQPARSHVEQQREQVLIERTRTKTLWGTADEEFDCDPCASNLPQDVDLDRREALFSMIGMAWATGVLPAATLLGAEPANAVYGSDAKIELPNPVQAMTDRATKQCLVESLGTRECLVYAGDVENRLYQGADAQLLLSRVERAAQSLSAVPALVQAKKWSQVTGVLTGPMGELVRTMNQLVQLNDDAAAESKAKAKVALVKKDLYAIAAAVDRKNIDAALQSHQAATNHLVEFVQAL